MQQNQDITNNVINTINTIFNNLFESIDKNLYKNLDNLVFVNDGLLKNDNLNNLFGSNSSNGILLVANSLLIAIILYYSVKYYLNNLTNTRIESPHIFILKVVILGICMNNSYFIIGQALNINSNICDLIKSIGEDLFKTEITFSNLINTISNGITQSNDIFSVNGLIKGTLTFSLINLVFSYSLRYIFIKIFVLITPFALLSKMTEETSWFFKSWYKNIFSLFFIQILVSLILIILFSVDFNNENLLNKLIYLGGIYALIKANSISKEIVGRSNIRCKD